MKSVVGAPLGMLFVLYHVVALIGVAHGSRRTTITPADKVFGSISALKNRMTHGGL